MSGSKGIDPMVVDEDQTELQREFPLHVVCSWLGNSPRIAQQSYLLVTEDDFAKAAGVAKVMA